MREPTNRLDQPADLPLDAAVYAVGVARAEGKQAHVLLEPQGDPCSTLDFHAVAVIDGKRVDSSENLEQRGTP